MKRLRFIAMAALFAGTLLTTPAKAGVSANATETGVAIGDMTVTMKVVDPSKAYVPPKVKPRNDQVVLRGQVRNPNWLETEVKLPPERAVASIDGARAPASVGQPVEIPETIVAKSVKPLPKEKKKLIAVKLHEKKIRGQSALKIAKKKTGKPGIEVAKALASAKSDSIKTASARDAGSASKMSSPDGGPPMVIPLLAKR